MRADFLLTQTRALSQGLVFKTHFEWPNAGTELYISRLIPNSPSESGYVEISKGRFLLVYIYIYLSISRAFERASSLYKPPMKRVSGEIQVKGSLF